LEWGVKFVSLLKTNFSLPAPPEQEIFFGHHRQSDLRKQVAFFILQ